MKVLFTWKFKSVASLIAYVDYQKLTITAFYIKYHHFNVYVR